MINSFLKIIFIILVLADVLGCQSQLVRKNPYENASTQELLTFKKVDLPFSSGTEFKISQGAFGCCTHKRRGYEYAWDFDVPYGTEVTAVESGKVIQVWEPNKGGGCDAQYNDVAHNIKIEDSNGMIAQYVHVQSKVQIGEYVHAGQLIGVTANNGFHCTPQLHFNFFKDKNHIPENGAPETIPIYFNGLPDGLAREGFKGSVSPQVDFISEFGPRDGCILISNIQTAKVLVEYNPKRCQERLSPCSSFKIAAAAMAFEKGILKDENQIIRWDKIKRDRPEVNQDQTPFTWMSESVKWVTEWIMPQLGEKSIHRFLNTFEYGNKDFSGGNKDAWVTSSLKITAHEQVAFLTHLWKEDLPLSKRSMELTKKIIFIKNLGQSSELFGKTGTGCLHGHDCMDHPGLMLGWFVGVLKTPSGDYAFAANASDLTPQERPAGPRLRKTSIEIFEKLGLLN